MDGWVQMKKQMEMDEQMIQLCSQLHTLIMDRFLDDIIIINGARLHIHHKCILINHSILFEE